MARIKQFTFNVFGENTYVVSDETGACVIIDPGCYQPNEEQDLNNYIQSQKLTVELLLNTHCHVDHVLGNQFVKKEYGVPLHIPVGEKEVLESVKSYAPVWGFPQYQPVEPDKLFEPKGSVTFGETSLKILSVPGHAPGHVAFYYPEGNWCINGDVLFRGSIGRTDLPGGDHEQLLASIRNVMFALPDDTVIYCGHGPETSIGFEKAHNPFLA